MQHVVKFSPQEKLNIWLDLCDLTFRLMKSSLSSNELRRRLKKMRQAHLEQDYLILSKLAKLK